MNKSITNQVKSLEAELANLVAQEDALDIKFECGEYSEEDCQEYENNQDEQKKVRALIKEAMAPKGLCKNTANLVAENID